MLDVELSGQGPDCVAWEAVTCCPRNVGMVEGGGPPERHYTYYICKPDFVNRYMPFAPEELKKKYPVWVARYGEYKPYVHLLYWQLSPDGRVRGIRGDVDIDVFNGSGTVQEVFADANREVTFAWEAWFYTVSLFIPFRLRSFEGLCKLKEEKEYCCQKDSKGWGLGQIHACEKVRSGRIYTDFNAFKV